MTSPTSNSVYHAEIKGVTQNRQAQVVYDSLHAQPQYGQDSHALCAVTGLTRTNVTRALNDLYECRIPGLWVDYILRPSNASGRSAKHFYRVDAPPARARLSELLVREGWRKDGSILWKKGWQIRKLHDGTFSVTHPFEFGNFRGDLNTKNYRVILDAVMGGGK